ncbi:hypothetical protein L211DRAFT_600176 [Terfezia boudieri ATCC MYA-4762]|uniref:Uncharacterized protein n=1 Tax=Terfezia boudieri ATCC MYA-4762 TaxID=1051890 RepID=A0A3N4LVP7_9PEZI|nr:hypothetical protein L211DRAFT_600176 [Terfezia boudieri ATCC MYA-4762]
MLGMLLVKEIVRLEYAEGVRKLSWNADGTAMNLLCPAKKIHSRGDTLNLPVFNIIAYKTIYSTKSLATCFWPGPRAPRTKVPISLSSPTESQPRRAKASNWTQRAERLQRVQLSPRRSTLLTSAPRTALWELLTTHRQPGMPVGTQLSCFSSPIQAMLSRSLSRSYKVMDSLEVAVIRVTSKRYSTIVHIWQETPERELR